MRQQYQLIHLPSGRAVATVGRASHWWEKGWGLLGRRALLVGEGLWLPGVTSVHTALMKFPLDLLFLDSEYQAVRLAPQTPPWKLLVRAPGACHTLELGAGTLKQFAPGVRLGDGWELEPDPGGAC